MRVVLYDHETYEPITVFDVPGDLMRQAISRQRRTLHVPIFPTMAAPESSAANVPMMAKNLAITVSFEPIEKGGRIITWLCTTGDGESALLLRSAFLPGQSRAVNDIEQSAFMRGLMKALEG